ncbi:MAG: alpha/beta hydrolase [Myxococcota bacterium]|nr:alpha/beta hydrolase [Myxococcota bacterium]
MSEILETDPQRPQSRSPWLAIIPLLAGALWLLQAAGLGLLGFILLLPIGGGLLASGLAQLLWAGDLRINQTLALCGLLGVLLSFPLVIWLGLWSALWLAATAAGSILCAGASAVAQEPDYARVPRPELGPRLAGLVAMDEATLGFEQFSIRVPSGDKAEELVGEVLDGLDLFAERGWLENPAEYHLTPPPLVDPRITVRRTGKTDYEHLSFESLYTPHPDEPGKERWLGYENNRTAHAYVMRQAEESRPWLICCNGYRSGSPAMDVRLFRRYHEELGLNVLIPVLPLHGPRKIGRISGEGFLSSQILDSLHAEAQAMWDIRRMHDWIRSQDAPAVGAMGLSLGGYTTALLSCLEPGLACAIAGIPVADFSRLFWRHGPRSGIKTLESLELDQLLVERLLRPVSPLKLKPQVPHARRMIFGGTADRLVSPDQVRDLIEHWEHPRTVWYEGGHMSFFLDERVNQGIDETLREAGLRG